MTNVPTTVAPAPSVTSTMRELAPGLGFRFVERARSMLRRDG